MYYFTRTTDLSLIGAKAQGLLKLAEHGFTVPLFWALDAKQVSALRESRQWTPELHHQLQALLCNIPSGATLAVRSSGQVSMPGMLATETDIADNGRAVLESILRVAESWDRSRAVAHRERYRIPQDYAMGIVVQHYIAPTSAEHRAGVLLTRRPSDGSTCGLIEMVAGAGKGLVDGTARPVGAVDTLKIELGEIAYRAERIFKGPQEIEFVYNGSKLYVVQVRPQRNLRREDDLRIAKQLLREGAITLEEANKLIAPGLAKAKWYLAVDEEVADLPIATGLGSVPGAFTGVLALRPPYSPQSIFCAATTEVDDAEAMMQCGAVLTAVGGITCHASMLASFGGITAVVNAGFAINEKHDCIDFQVGERSNVGIRHGSLVTIDGTTGKVYAGAQPITDCRNHS